MDQTTTAAIYSWIETHPGHMEDYDFDLRYDDTDFVVNKVVANSEKLIDYEDVESFSMNGTQVENGCDYVFKRGPMMSGRCNVEPREGSRCEFHKHAIFSNEIGV